MTVEALIEQLLQLEVRGGTSRSWNEIEKMFPPGIGDEHVRKYLAELASDCGCELKILPQYASITFVKK